tara:strand:- start:2707 stop:2919 length:213 start_codon:yes stop_codon:yes gene_type:complete
MAQRSLNEMEHNCFMYLHTLRESGAVNMLGSTPYLVRDMGIDETTARGVLALWMKYFNREGEYDDLMIDA